MSAGTLIKLFLAWRAFKMLTAPSPAPPEGGGDQAPASSPGPRMLSGFCPFC